jgi:2'-5' RNA ligase
MFGAMASSRLAVALVVLPSAAVARRAIALNRRLEDRTLRLGPRAWPHLTLAMACVDRDAIGAIASHLRGPVADERAFDVTLTRTVTVPGATHVTAWYDAAKSRVLQRWHRRAVALLDRYRRPGPAARDFAVSRGGTVSNSARRWVRRYAQDAAGPRYRPHITLGYGAAPSDGRFPLVFRARRLALCHLGDHCTCARVLAEFRLAARSASAGQTRVN